LSEKGMSGMKQNVNHSQRFITLENGGVSEFIGEEEGGRKRVWVEGCRRENNWRGEEAVPAAEVTAVLALYSYVLCAGELGVEDVGSAGEEEEHVCGLCARVALEVGFVCVCVYS
jgi:hypothetical protein